MPPSRGKWKPTDEQVKQIESLAAVGLSDKDMASILGVSESTFTDAGKLGRSALRQAVLKGRAKANARIGQRAFEMADRGDNAAMTIFWLKCRMGWKDTSKVEHSGPDGEPLENAPTKVIVNIPNNGR